MAGGLWLKQRLNCLITRLLLCVTGCLAKALRLSRTNWRLLLLLLLRVFIILVVMERSLVGTRLDYNCSANSSLRLVQQHLPGIEGIVNDLDIVAVMLTRER